MHGVEVTAPLIGLTAYARNEQGRFHLPAAYCEAVVRVGGLPVLLPPVQVNVKAWLARLDGLVLTGGDDIAPDGYDDRPPAGTDPPHRNGGADLLRDVNELAMVEEVLKSRLPTLAICRGMQMLNVALGGTLVPDIADEFGKRVVHRLPPRQPAPHSVAVEPESRLATILGATHCAPVSSHHQAIRRLGAGLQVVARAADGVIEAVELPEAPWLVAVQWHPELSAAMEPIQQRLFEYLITQAAEAAHST